MLVSWYYLMQFGIFFLFLLHATTTLVIIYYIAQIRGLALQLEYLEGSTDIVMEGQKEQTRLIIALVENSA